MNFIIGEEKSRLLERFLSYVRVWTTSDTGAADSGIIPSTERQFTLAKMLESELKSLGAKNVCVTDHCYVYAEIESSAGYENSAPFCLLSHMDTVDEVSGEDVNAILTEKDGDTIISTDGKTLLGADDKAGIAAIMSAVDYLSRHKEILHGPFEVCFSPDEETGHGMDFVPLELIKSKKAYTVDGGSKGELEFECFNAYKSEVTFEGVACHTGSAKGKLVNAITMASHFINSLPPDEFPETTEGKEGFFAPLGIKGSMEQSFVSLLLRDFEKDGIERRKQIIKENANATAKKFGGKVNVTHKLQYLNMRDKLLESPEITENLVRAYKNAGIEPVFTPIRGGTDGSRLTEMGIPTPNIFTGGHEFHSRTEWCSLNEMSAACDVLINLCIESREKR